MKKCLLILLKKSLKESENNIMDLDELKKMLDSAGSKVVITEDGKPTLVVMRFEDYKKIKGEEVNDKDLPLELKQEPLKVEDLPF